MFASRRMAQLLRSMTAITGCLDSKHVKIFESPNVAGLKFKMELKINEIYPWGHTIVNRLLVTMETFSTSPLDAEIRIATDMPAARTCRFVLNHINYSFLSWPYYS